MNIAIQGCCGRMGRTVAATVHSTTSHRVVAGIDLSTPGEELGFPVYRSLQKVTEPVDVVIDFSRPEGIQELLTAAAARGVPVVIATSGLDEKELQAISEASKTIPVLRGANMSIGINLLQRLVTVALETLDDTFDVELIEGYHNRKADAPSGTSRALLETVRQVRGTEGETVFGRGPDSPPRKRGDVAIHSIRGGTIVGEHEVVLAGEDEVMTINHRAFSRSLFAKGAIKAAEFLQGKPPALYTMADVVAGH
jgi:4-hydroxy-tetrahydrodipicolinate reductase